MHVQLNIALSSFASISAAQRKGIGGKAAEILEAWRGFLELGISTFPGTGEKPIIVETSASALIVGLHTSADETKYFMRGRANQGWQCIGLKSSWVRGRQGKR